MATGIGASLQRMARWPRLLLSSVLLGLAVPLALAVAIAAFHAYDPTVDVQPVAIEYQAMADDDRTPCRESHKISDGSCIAALGCVACTVLPQDVAVVVVQVPAAARPLSSPARTQIRIYPVHQPPRFASI